MSQVEEPRLFGQLLCRCRPRRYFRPQMLIQTLGSFCQLMLPQRAEQQGLVHLHRRFMGLRTFGHLNHDPDTQLLLHERPHRIGPEDRHRLGRIFFYVTDRFPGTENLINQSHAFVLFREQFGKGPPDKLFRRLFHQEAKGGIHIMHDMGCTLHRGHGQRRILERETRQAGRLRRRWGGCGHRFLNYFFSLGSGAGSSRRPTRVGIPVVSPV